VPPVQGLPRHTRRAATALESPLESRLAPVTVAVTVRVSLPLAPYLLIYRRYRLDRWGQKRHYGVMPNHRPKGAETMRKLGRSGGLKSGETRRANRAERIKWETGETAKDGDQSGVSYMSGVTGGPFTWEQIAEAMRAGWMRGGLHETDWRCSQCRHFNSEKRQSCAKCAYAPGNGRLTRAAIRARRAERATQAYLRKFRLTADQR